ncbi:hypothetical protein [Hymenobacter koreensis]|uniref:Uncharacterized protein n=1 Tax=Hymenobacter koreensis TaxID=1084523 RepID=A0ABP8JJK4_9BACT
MKSFFTLTVKGENHAHKRLINLFFYQKSYRILGLAENDIYTYKSRAWVNWAVELVFFVLLVFALQLALHLATGYNVPFRNVYGGVIAVKAIQALLRLR